MDGSPLSFLDLIQELDKKERRKRLDLLSSSIDLEFSLEKGKVGKKIKCDLISSFSYKSD